MYRTTPIAEPDTTERDQRPAGGVVADIILSRFRRLTAREVRLLILVVQDGLGRQELAAILGVSVGGVANVMQSVRRKLAVPRHQDLRDFVRRVPQLSAVLASDGPTRATGYTQAETRRRQDLLRVTIDELQSVATRARRRAASLEAFPRSDEDDTDQRQEEAAMAVRIAELVESTVTHVLAEARRHHVGSTARRASSI